MVASEEQILRVIGKIRQQEFWIIEDTDIENDDEGGNWSCNRSLLWFKITHQGCLRSSSPRAHLQGLGGHFPFTNLVQQDPRTMVWCIHLIVRILELWSDGRKWRADSVRYGENSETGVLNHWGYGHHKWRWRMKSKLQSLTFVVPDCSPGLPPKPHKSSSARSSRWSLCFHKSQSAICICINIPGPLVWCIHTSHGRNFGIKIRWSQVKSRFRCEIGRIPKQEL
jgi:hypothetical protein